MDKEIEGYNSCFGFKSIDIFKEQTLGIGSYGKVYKAKCDDLLCAAKLIHETLFDPIAKQLIAAPQREHRLPMRRFVQECEFLSTIRHPNIVQYLGIYRDPDTGLPALLMELMDNSLTHFLESSTQPIPYHIQVNIGHDITLALSFLHSNNIVHRDLSSNNVLLIGNAIKAKVTDFGMARLCDENQQTTHFSYTTCPGTNVYMPPEAVRDNPVYTEKIDCFSFGVIIIQILTQHFPKPGDRCEQINFPSSPSGIAEIPVSEIKRRENHISKIDPNNGLLQISLDCLKDRDVERPSAQQLCERVADLKERLEYNESMRAADEKRNMPVQDRVVEREEIRLLKELCRQQEEVIQSLQFQLEESRTKCHKCQTLIPVDEMPTTEPGKDMAGLKNVENYYTIEEKGRSVVEVECAAGQHQEDKICSDELEQTRSPSVPPLKQSSSSSSVIKMSWRKGMELPPEMTSGAAITYACVDHNALYITMESQDVYTFTQSASIWSRLPKSPTKYCSPVIINGLLTLVGGYDIGGSATTNQLFSLTDESGDRKKWTEVFPPMPTKRQAVTALCTGTTLIIAGGRTKHESKFIDLTTVEMMDMGNLQWSVAADLFEPITHAPAALCGAYLYILGKHKMYVCPVRVLIQSCRSTRLRSLWK